MRNDRERRGRWSRKLVLLTAVSVTAIAGSTQTAGACPATIDGLPVDNCELLYTVESTVNSATADADVEVAPPSTGTENAVGEATGIEGGFDGGVMFGDDLGVGVDVRRIAFLPEALAIRVDSGEISLEQAAAARGVVGCYVSFRRRVDIVSPTFFIYDWGGRTSCDSNVRMSGQAFLRGRGGAGTTHDSGPGYGPLSSKNRYDGNRKVFSSRRAVSIELYTNVTLINGRFRGYIFPVANQTNVPRSSCDPRDGNFTYYCRIVSRDYK